MRKGVKLNKLALDYNWNKLFIPSWSWKLNNHRIHARNCWDIVALGAKQGWRHPKLNFIKAFFISVLSDIVHLTFEHSPGIPVHSFHAGILWSWDTRFPSGNSSQWWCLKRSKDGGLHHGHCLSFILSNL